MTGNRDWPVSSLSPVTVHYVRRHPYRGPFRDLKATKTVVRRVCGRWSASGISVPSDGSRPRRVLGLDDMMTTPSLQATRIFHGGLLASRTFYARRKRLASSEETDNRNPSWPQGTR